MARKKDEFVPCSAQREGDPAPCTNPVTADKRVGCPLHCSKPVKHRRDCGEDCRIRTPHSDRFCANSPMVGREQCRLHGGKARRGMAHGMAKHGAYVVTDMPAQMAKDFLAAQSDPDLQNLNLEIKILRARLNGLLRKLQENEVSAGALKPAVGAYKKAKDAKDADAARVAIEKIVEIVEEGGDSKPLEKELDKLIELTAFVKDAQSKQKYRIAKTITGDQMMLIMTRTLNIIQTNVTDKRTLDAIQRGVMELMMGRQRALPPAVGLSEADDDGDDDAIDAELVG